MAWLILFYGWVVLHCQRRQWHPTPVLLPGKSHGQRSLAGCSPRGREELDMTEQLHFPFSLSCIGEGNGNPLQCSCLENPRDGGAWWAAVYGVAQSRTRLKWLSSSSIPLYIHVPHLLYLFICQSLPVFLLFINILMILMEVILFCFLQRGICFWMKCSNIFSQISVLFCSSET